MYTYARKIDCEAMFWPNPGALCGYIGWYIGTGISPSSCFKVYTCSMKGLPATVCVQLQSENQTVPGVASRRVHNSSHGVKRLTT